MSIVFWSDLMEQISGALKTEKLSLIVLFAVGIIAWKGWLWADTEHEDFVKLTHLTKLENLILNQNEQMKEHKEEFRIVSAQQLVRDKQLELEIAPATGKSEKEIQHIEEELGAAKLYESCLINQRPNCQHLRPRG